VYWKKSLTEFQFLCNDLLKPGLKTMERRDHLKGLTDCVKSLRITAVKTNGYAALMRG
jgi:hypothetical protein